MKQEFHDILTRVKNNDPTLQEVVIDNNDDKYTYEINSENIIAELLEAIGTNRFIKTLALKGCFMNGDYGVKLCNALLVNTSITSLCLDNNNLWDADAEVYANLMASNRTIQHYDFDNSFFYDDALEYFAEAVKSNKMILSLILSNGGEFSIEGTNKFFTAVKESNINRFKIDSAIDFVSDQEWNEYNELLRTIELWVESRKTPDSATVSENTTESQIAQRSVLSAASPSLINTRLQNISATTTFSQEEMSLVSSNLSPIIDSTVATNQLGNKTTRLSFNNPSLSDDESDNNTKRQKHR